MRFLGQSWIGQYHNYVVQSQEGIVLFKTMANEQVDNSNFTIFIRVTGNTKYYFLPKTDWYLVEGYTRSQLIPAGKLSQVTNGVVTKPFPYSKPSYYIPPYFIAFKTSPKHEANFLPFNSFGIQNSEKCVLSVLTYSNDTNTFDAVYEPPVTLTASNTLVFNNVLEFVLLDATQNIVPVRDGSHLFLTIKTDYQDKKGN